ncbi:MAG TPA: hypothetical protein VFP98_06205 [Candidatus Polarisedimenticolia bacterium]|nr:hypothetical protein [Candidatus Polarisedimenticolia bacterium]
MAREAAVVYKGARTWAERYPTVQAEVGAELRELMASAESKIRNIHQQGMGIRLKYRDDVVSPLPDEAWDVYYVDGDAYNENCHFSVGFRHHAVEIGLVIPNHAKTRQWERFNTLARDKDKFLEMMRALRAEVPELWIHMKHRHDMGGQKVVEDGEGYFKVDTIFGFDVPEAENRYFKTASSWYVLMKELVSERLNHRFNLELRFFAPYFTEPEDPRRQYREKIQPYQATPDQPRFTEEVIRVVNAYTPLFSYLLG